MKRISLFTFTLATASALLAQNNNGKFTGEIMDKQCAQMGSHENMMKAEGAKNARECTLACVKNGDSFALLDPQTKKVYPIEGGKNVQQFAGERVQITGDYDQSADILHVQNITRAH
jgi:hypothetical protein